MTITQYFDSLQLDSYKLFTARASIPVGGIIYWSTLSIPPGWNICDGTNGTPDLRSRFVVGYNLSDPSFNTLNNVGGKKTVTLTLNEIPSHSHTLPGDTVYSTTTQNYDSGSGIQRFKISSSTVYTGNIGGGNSHDNIPPYCVLIYIMRKY